MHRLPAFFLLSLCFLAVSSVYAQGIDTVEKSEYRVNQLRQDAIDYRDHAAYVRNHVSDIRSRMMKLDAADSAAARLDAIREVIGSWDAAAQAWEAAAHAADIAAQAWDAVQEAYRLQDGQDSPRRKPD